MNKPTLARMTLLSSLAITALSTGVLAQESEVSFKSTEISDGIFMVEGVGGFGGGNMAVLVGETYVAMVDDGLAPLAPKLLNHVTNTAGRKINFMIVRV